MRSLWPVLSCGRSLPSCGGVRLSRVRWSRLVRVIAFREVRAGPVRLSTLMRILLRIALSFAATLQTLYPRLFPTTCSLASYSTLRGLWSVSAAKGLPDPRASSLRLVLVSFPRMTQVVFSTTFVLVRRLPRTRFSCGGCQEHGSVAEAAKNTVQLLRAAANGPLVSVFPRGALTAVPF